MCVCARVCVCIRACVCVCVCVHMCVRVCVKERLENGFAPVNLAEAGYMLTCIWLHVNLYMLTEGPVELHNTICIHVPIIEYANHRGNIYHSSQHDHNF